MAGIVRPTNAFLDTVFYLGRTKNVYYNLFLFDRETLLTAKDLESIRTRKLLSELELLNLVSDKGKYAPLARLKTERSHSQNITVYGEWSAGLASDPIELTVITEGTPNTFLLIGTLENKTIDLENLVDNSFVENVLIGTVGALGSGADVELLNGTVSYTSTYKFNSFTVNLPE